MAAHQSFLCHVLSLTTSLLSPPLSPRTSPSSFSMYGPSLPRTIWSLTTTYYMVPHYHGRAPIPPLSCMVPHYRAPIPAISFIAAHHSLLFLHVWSLTTTYCMVPHYHGRAPLTPLSPCMVPHYHVLIPPLFPRTCPSSLLILAACVASCSSWQGERRAEERRMLSENQTERPPALLRGLLLS